MRYGANFIGTCMVLACTTLGLHGALTYTAHVFASSCMALVRCIIFASLVFWNKFHVESSKDLSVGLSMQCFCDAQSEILVLEFFYMCFGFCKIY